MNESICVKYNVSMNDLMELMEHSKDVACMINNVDKLTEIYGSKPTPRQISKMAKYKGITYQRRGTQNQDRPQTSISKVPLPPKENIPPSNTDLNIDLGGWINNAKRQTTQSRRRAFSKQYCVKK